MVKVMFTWKDNPGMSVEEAEAHYLDIHTKLAIECFKDAPGFRAYVQNRVKSQTVHDFNGREPRTVTPEFDRFVELHFDDMETLEAAFARPQMQAAFDDHPNFMAVDIPENIKVFVIEEAIPLERDFVRGG